jgi:chromosome segregation ATPase
MRTLTLLASLVVAAPVGLYLVAGRPLGELFGFTRAGAQVGVERAIEQVPVEIRDQKLDNDMEFQRRALTDHQVALNLAQRELQSLTGIIADLEGNLARRERLLAEAYPVLQKAMADGLTEVQFAGSARTLEEFQRDIDQLLGDQERESKQLGIRREGLTKLELCVVQGEEALSEMRDSLLALEQEIDLLRARREQARMEGQTLELIGAVSASAQPASGEVGAEAARLRQEVDRLEAGNEAKRENLPGIAKQNRVAADWERLERLKAFQGTKAAPTGAGAEASEASAASPSPGSSKTPQEPATGLPLGEL